MLDKLSELEKINETFHFKFNKDDESVKHVTHNSALYISIKRAFTPYAVLHMLRQIQIAFSLKDHIQITEKFPLLFYTLKHEHTTFMIKSDVHSSGLHNLQCTCFFSKNYNLVCWHQIALLEKLQIKNINCFENLGRYRDVVGRRVITGKSEKKDSMCYQPKKERRLKSFIEGISAKHQERVK